MSEQISNHSGTVMPPQSVPPQHTQPSVSPSGYAIAAFVLGILSFVTCGPCAGIPALILGLVELRHIKNQASPIEGKPFALAGAILGGISSAFLIIVILFYVGVILIALLAQGALG